MPIRRCSDGTRRRSRDSRATRGRGAAGGEPRPSSPDCEHAGAARLSRPDADMIHARALLLLVVLAVVAGIAYRVLHTTQDGTPAVGHGSTGALTTTNSAGRSGAFYLPSGYPQHPLPLLVALHGTGGSGSSMVTLFQSAADRDGFLILAPESRIAPSGQATGSRGPRRRNHGRLRARPSIP